MNGVWSLSPTRIRPPMWVMLKISICNLVWLAEYQCKCVIQPKVLVLIIYLFSLNLISRGIKGESGSSSLNLRTVGGGGARKRTRVTKRGGGGVKTRESWPNVLFECPLVGLSFQSLFISSKAAWKLIILFILRDSFCLICHFSFFVLGY